ncbi:MAG: hypothetical protein ACR2OH_13965, partial [Microthrixaceae bacterium]
NNPYLFSGPPDFGRRPSLGSGTLGIHAAGEGTTAKGTSTSAVRSWETGSLRIESDETILAGLDGEAVQFESPLELSIRPKALKVLVPSGTEPGYKSIGEAFKAGLEELATLAGIGTS